MPGDKRAWTMAGGLPLLAALAPQGAKVTVIDEAVEDIDFAALVGFDVIGLTGMIVQRDRMLEILNQLKSLPAKVVVGGPYVSIDEGFFDGVCDAIFVGEADTTWPAYLEAVANGGKTKYRYEQDSPTDMTQVPPARMDVLKHQHYMSASMQYSRGCPFTCEFCDIIVIFGRRPRVKTSKQVLAEVAAQLNQCPNAVVEVEGHTDSDGAADANLTLSVMRAERVVDELLELGVDATRLFAVGYGETLPIASNETQGSKRLNRRIVFAVREAVE